MLSQIVSLIIYWQCVPHATLPMMLVITLSPESKTGLDAWKKLDR
jgi:hypothetical protein